MNIYIYIHYIIYCKSTESDMLVGTANNVLSQAFAVVPYYCLKSKGCVQDFNRMMLIIIDQTGSNHLLWWVSWNHFGLKQDRQKVKRANQKTSWNCVCRNLHLTIPSELPTTGSGSQTKYKTISKYEETNIILLVVHTVKAIRTGKASQVAAMVPCKAATLWSHGDLHGIEGRSFSNAFREGSRCW